MPGGAKPEENSGGGPQRSGDANRYVDLGIEGERLIEPSSSWFPRSFPRDRLELRSRVLSGRAAAAASLSRAAESRAPKWAIFGKQNWRSRDEPGSRGSRCPTASANLEPTKGVGRLRQRGGGHGSRNPLRSV
ncbi:hypothetical protein OIU85_001113 [Salix viminalis]|uniref:Uncharacterized protein n=1 Tax=Salix viminalis TaxID=40686 RepID=A0A9Q0ZXF8_SALVM|nr:hypothetical protein OIU85_001113 [Salix viminalis]